MGMPPSLPTVARLHQTSLAESPRDRANRRRDLGLPESANIILCAAALDLESGVFLLPEVAEQLSRMTPTMAFHFVIVGQEAKTHGTGVQQQYRRLMDELAPSGSWA